VQFRGRSRRDDGDIGCNLCAVELQRQIIDFVAKRVFNLVADGCKPENDVRCDDSDRNVEPGHLLHELDWKCYNVDPSNLRYGNCICDRQWSVENPICSNKECRLRTVCCALSFLGWQLVGIYHCRQQSEHKSSCTPVFPVADYQVGALLASIVFVGLALLLGAYFAGDLARCCSFVRRWVFLRYAQMCQDD
jgi:hypothetical protein